MVLHLKWFISISLEGNVLQSFIFFLLLRACEPSRLKRGSASSEINCVSTLSSSGDFQRELINFLSKYSEFEKNINLNVL